MTSETEYTKAMNWVDVYPDLSVDDAAKHLAVLRHYHLSGYVVQFAFKEIESSVQNYLMILIETYMGGTYPHTDCFSLKYNYWNKYSIQDWIDCKQSIGMPEDTQIENITTVYNWITRRLREMDEISKAMIGLKLNVYPIKDL